MPDNAASLASFRHRLSTAREGLITEILRERLARTAIKKEKTARRNIARIIEAALAVIQEKGFAGMTMRDLSAASGLSPGALYTYFGSKEELRTMIMRYGARFAASVIAEDAAKENDPVRALAAAIRAHLYLSEIERPWFYFAYMEAAALTAGERRSAMVNERLTESIFRSLLEHGTKGGRLRAKDPALTSAAIKAMLQDWYVKRWKYRELDIGVEDYAQFVIGFVLDALGDRPAPLSKKQGAKK